MNTRLIFLIILLFGVFWQSAHGRDNEDLAARIDFCATEIRKIIDQERWNVEVSSTTIVIESKFQVGIQRRVSPSLDEKPVSSNYRIELCFKPKLSKDAYIELAKERVEYASILNYGAKTKEEWSNAFKFLTNNPLPRYDVTDRVGRSYSVYIATPDSFSVSILPVEKYAEVKGVEAVVDQTFWQHAN